MSDKAANSHVEHTVYVSPETTSGSSIRWGDWSDSETATFYVSTKRDRYGSTDGYYARGIPMTIIESASGSDCSGSLVERSNMRVLQRQFPWLVELHGNYSTFGLAYLGARENQNPALIEMLDSLAAYPLASDDDHSELEHDVECDAWDDYGRYDFAQALEKLFNELDVEYEHNIGLAEQADEAAGHDWQMQLLDLWRDGCDAFNVNGGSGCANQQGDSIYFYIDEWISKLSRHADKVPQSREYTHNTFRAWINTLCDASRVKE